MSHPTGRMFDDPVRQVFTEGSCSFLDKRDKIIKFSYRVNVTDGVHRREDFLNSLHCLARSLGFRHGMGAHEGSPTDVVHLRRGGFVELSVAFFQQNDEEIIEVIEFIKRTKFANIKRHFVVALVLKMIVAWILFTILFCVFTNEIFVADTFIMTFVISLLAFAVLVGNALEKQRRINFLLSRVNKK